MCPSEVSRGAGTAGRSSPWGEMAKFDEDQGKLVLPEDRQRFLDWHVKTAELRAEDGDPPTQRAYAQVHGVDVSTLTRWKRDPLWQRALESRLTELNVTPDRLQGIIDTMYKIATDRDHKNVVQAATLYLQYVEKLKPTKVLVEATGGDSKTMSDEELDRELEAEIVALRAVREVGPKVS